MNNRVNLSVDCIARLNGLFIEFLNHSEEYYRSIGKDESSIDSFKQLITVHAPKALSDELLEPNLKVKGSVGVGRITSCPWIAIMDKRITKTAQEGVYLVFLFSRDLKTIYLTANQGTTRTDEDVYEKTREDLKHLFPEDSVKIDTANKDYNNAAIFAAKWDLNDHHFCQEVLNKLIGIYEDNVDIFLETMKHNDSYIPAVNINEEALDRLVSQYVNAFEQNWSAEQYKWKAVKHFQDNWDIDAPDFHTMLKNSLAETENLLSSSQHFPRKMILRFAEAYPEDVREMFRSLYDESLGLSFRIKSFIKKSDGFKHSIEKVDGKKLQSYQDENAVTTYLWLRKPDVYYIYKYSEARAVFEHLNASLSIKKGAGTMNVRRAFALYDIIRDILSYNPGLKILLEKKLSESNELYDDPDRYTLTSDFVFFVSERIESKPSKAEPASKMQPSLFDSSVDPAEYKFAEDSGKPFMSEDDFNRIVGLLKRKKNIILQGPPGVGKTFMAKRIAYGLMGVRDDTRIKLIQFHQNYSYEDFVIGYKPAGDSFKLKPGIFYKLCKDVANSSKNHVLIIDEINRGNMSKIFGELLMLIEKQYRGVDIDLPYTDDTYNSPFYVPENLYIIGMMNTADRSLAMIDYALRRRFSFIDLRPAFDEKTFEDYQQKIDNVHFNSVIGIVKDINNKLEKGFEIGHSFFCNLEKESCTDTLLKEIIDYEIMPTLREYWFDDEESVKSYRERFDSIFR